MESGIDDGRRLSRAIWSDQYLWSYRGLTSGAAANLDVFPLYDPLDGHLHSTLGEKVQELNFAVVL